jgi:2-hydroxy-3-keto-5-methylthiopentenyl-1-phosphate phosphatase
MKIADYKYFYFDLDRNIWDTTDKYGNPIWARQLIFPVIKNNCNEYIDDCLSVIKLQDGIEDYLEFLRDKNVNIGFISRGANLNITYKNQPSFLMLEKFNILKYFNAEHILLHKNEKKHLSINRNKFVYFDDSPEEISLMTECKEQSYCILRNDFKSWRDLF